MKPDPTPTAERIRTLLHDRLADDLSLDDITRELSLSRAYVVRVFRRAYGVPPHEYLMQIRVSRACTLLRQGGRPTDVAHLCGFYDQSHLNRWFRKIVGVTPGAYGESLRVSSAGDRET
jgi:AraC-like DNA-binding protein